MSLATSYCKEIANELRQIPVYLPGINVQPGDIIGFKGTTLLGVPKPIGDFTKIGSLSDFKIDLETEEDSNTDLDSYVFASKGSVNVSFEANGNVGDQAKGKLKIGFTKEGSTYLSALDCKEKRFKSIITLEDKLAEHKDAIEWKHFFIVTAVTIATKALIMQSNSKTANLEIEGDVKNLIPTGMPTKNLSASLSLAIKKYEDASFIKDWSNNVPVFFKLVRYKKKFLGGWDLETRKFSKITEAIAERSKTKKDPYIIDEVDPSELAE